ncbi:MAG: TrkA family potassium uptake protein [Halofilum sp. (in: g-proteobacteria)]|nr:TrkA family potassium uptake protein [Halofilum sp. (in: g-proteobacteria)]
MRAVFVGGSRLAMTTAQCLLTQGHEVVVIERDKATIDALSEDLDAGFLQGDGSRPAVLKEADPAATDLLFCLTNHDQANIIASLVGRSLGFKRVITKIEDAEYEHICIELGLEDTIIPTQTVGRFLADMSGGKNPLELSAMIKDEARVFSFVVHKDDAGPIADLDLPSKSRVMCLYRQERFLLPQDDMDLEPDDEVVLITHSRNIPKLRRRWYPAATE